MMRGPINIREHNRSADTTTITAVTLDQKDHHPITSEQISRASLGVMLLYRKQSHTHAQLSLFTP